MPNSTVGDRTPFILSATVDFPDDVARAHLAMNCWRK